MKLTLPFFICIPIVLLLLSSVTGAQTTLIREEAPESSYTPLTEGIQGENEAVLIREDPAIRDLRKQADEKEKHIQETEEEIADINKELEKIYQEKNTLQGQLNSLTLEEKRNVARLTIIKRNIEHGQISLQGLSKSIDRNEENIALLREVLSKNYRRTNELELRGEDAPIFLNETLFETLQYIEEVVRYSSSLSEHLQLLEGEIQTLEENRENITQERIKLEKQEIELEDRRRLYEFSILNKERLVRETKNSESVYQTLLQEKQEERRKLQQELYEYESQIEYIQDPDALPRPKPGLLLLPFSIPPRVTQAFGQTNFARANSLKYGRPFHDGLDFGLPSGTPIIASNDGTVVGIGNTDIVSTCQSWGKWILIEHDFGLSTLYAHLSLQKVRLGEQVDSGELIGYSGNTGFSTGPHLHFGVYDAKGIKVVPYERVASSARCRGLLVPVAPQEAKLDPGKYLSL